MKISRSVKKKPLPEKRHNRNRNNFEKERSAIDPLNESKDNIPEANKKLMGSGKRQDDN